MFKKRKARYSKRKQMKDDLEKLMVEYNQRQLERQEYEELTQQKIQQEYEEQERIRLIEQEFPKLLLYQVSKACDLFTESDKIFISFRFQYKDESYKSWIVFTGRTYDKNGTQLSSKELLVQTPRIPLMGGCWSNHTAMRISAGLNLKRNRLHL